MRDVIVNLFGEYTPILDPVTGGVAVGLAGVDWTYLAGVFLFGVVLVALLKLLKGVLLHDC